MPHLAGYWRIDWIELSKADVTNVLTPAGSGDQVSAAIGPQHADLRLNAHNVP